MMAVDYGSFYVLLIVLPEITDCYETMHVLNYFSYPFNIEEDNNFRQIVKKEMGFSPNDDVSNIIHIFLNFI